MAEMLHTLVTLLQKRLDVPPRKVLIAQHLRTLNELIQHSSIWGDVADDIVEGAVISFDLFP